MIYPHEKPDNSLVCYPVNSLDFSISPNGQLLTLYSGKNQSYPVARFCGEFGCAGAGISFTNPEYQQFTGLKDYNGREIYEGDMLEYDNRDGYAVVKYDEEDGSYYLDGENLNWLDVFSDKRRWYRCEIKGNIFENPELLNS